MNNYIIFDIETTGLKPENGAEIIQISALALNGINLNPHHAGELNLVVKPENPDKADRKAIEIVGEEAFANACENGISQKVALQKFCNYCEEVNDGKNYMSKGILTGHNIRGYDVPFMEYWLRHYNILKVKKNGDLDRPYHFWFNDTLDYYRELFELDPSMPRYTLDACCAKLGLKRSGNIHDALEDVRLNAEIFIRYKKFIRKAHQMMRIEDDA